MTVVLADRSTNIFIRNGFIKDGENIFLEILNIVWHDLKTDAANDPVGILLANPYNHVLFVVFICK